LTSNGVNGKPGVSMPDEIVAQTSAKYVEAFEALTGQKWSA
jgi:phosphoribosylaminoimidazole-succinocarboxamide synthase